MKGLVFLACLMLLLAAPVAFAQYDDSGWDTSGYGTSSSCCCGTAFVLVAGLAAFTYAHQKK